MKKAIVFVLLATFVLGMLSCTQPNGTQAQYRVEFADDYEIENELERTYSPGEKVTVKLETLKEHSYLFYVNGALLNPDEPSSDDLTYTYYTFTMPSEDVFIEIEKKQVDASEEDGYSVFDTNNIKRITFYDYYGSGKGSDVPAENMAAIMAWLGTFTLDREVGDELIPPGTNTHEVRIEYYDGTVIKEGMDVVTVDGTLYYVKHATPPSCLGDILSKTSID